MSLLEEERLSLLQSYARVLHLTHQPSQELSILRKLVPLERTMSSSLEDTTFLRDSKRYGALLEDERKFDEAVNVWAEVIKIHRPLVPNNSSLEPSSGFDLVYWTNQLELSYCLKRYAEVSFKADPFSVADLDIHSSITTSPPNSKTLAAIFESLDIHHTLRSLSSSTYTLPKYASNLRPFAHFFTSCSLPHQSLPLYVLVVDIFRKLYNSDTSTYRFDLTRSLSEYHAVLIEVGELEKAEAISKEIVDVFRVLYQKRPSLYRNNFAMALATYAQTAMMRWKDGVWEGELEPDEAFEAWDESIELYRKLFAVETMYRTTLAAILADYASALLFASIQPQGQSPREPENKLLIQDPSEATSGEGRLVKGILLASEVIRLCDPISWSHDFREHERLREALDNLSKVAEVCGEGEITVRVRRHLGRLKASSS